MWITEMELSIRSVNILQKAGVWLLDDVVEKMRSEPERITLALALIKKEDFDEITDALKKRSKNVLDKTDKTQ
jgi:hypothetical protein